MKEFFRFWRGPAGTFAVWWLRLLSRIPPRILVDLGSLLLPGYRFFRPERRRSWRALQDCVPFALPSLPAYYRMRLRLSVLTLRHLAGYRNDLPMQIIGADHYQAALSSGRPVALMGWHQGPVELLHQVPRPPDDGRPFYIVAAPAFAPALTRFLHAGRARSGKRTTSPATMASDLKTWIRKRGVLAFMIDQVPGRPKEYLQLWESVSIPYPDALVEFCARHGALMLPVEVALAHTGQAIFRFHPAESGGAIMKIALQKRLESALTATPDQYNWSYPKIKMS